MIKPQFWEDPTLAQMSRDARLLFIGIWNHCDDMGVIPANPIYLKNRVFPYDEIGAKEVQIWLQELAVLERITRIEFHKTEYYLVPNFLKHQTINKPNFKDLFVPKSFVKPLLKDFSIDGEDYFDDEEGNFVPESGTIPVAITDDSGTNPVQIRSLSKGKERKEEVKRSKGKSFTPPEFEEVKTYFEERAPDWKPDKQKSEAEKFINRYNSVGWVVGKAKTKMTSWKGAAANWIKNEIEWSLERAKNGNKNTTTNTTNRPIASSGKTFGKL